jgi:membrane associated rhomboid family serine protease
MSPVYRVYPRKKKSFLSGLSVTSSLILVNLVCYFIIILLLNLYGKDFLSNNIAINPELILSGKNLWTFLTSMFAHVDLFHIFVNMFSLFFIGNFLEKIIGRKRFFWVYLISGFLGGIFFVFGSLIFGELGISALGASGAIFGVLGVLALIVPFTKIYLIVGPLIVIILDSILSLIFPSSSGLFSSIANILILIMVFSLFSPFNSTRKIAIPLKLQMWVLPIVAIVPLIIIGFYVDLPISNSGHLGGLVAGIIYGIYLRQKFPNKINAISKHFS